MSFLSRERSRTRGVPIELFLFQVGGALYAYTDADDDVVFDGVTYDAIPIQRAAISASGALDKSTLTVSLAQTTPLCEVLRAYPQSAVITLRIRQGHLGDGQFLIAWAGRVLSSKGRNGVRDLACQPVSSALRHVGLRRNWQYGCAHALYGDRCRASRLAATVTAPIATANKVTITLPDGWNAKPAIKYQGGLVSWAGEVRTIVRVVNDTTLVLGGPAPLAGTIVDLALGCAHTTDDCRTLHMPSDEPEYGGGNIRNYGGQPFIPQVSPIGFVSNFG